MASLAADDAGASGAGGSEEVQKWPGKSPQINDYTEPDFVYRGGMLSDPEEIAALEDLRNRFKGQSVATCDDTLIRNLMARDFNVVSTYTSLYIY